MSWPSSHYAPYLQLIECLPWEFHFSWRSLAVLMLDDPTSTLRDCTRRTHKPIANGGNILTWMGANFHTAIVRKGFCWPEKIIRICHWTYGVLPFFSMPWYGNITKKMTLKEGFLSRWKFGNSKWINMSFQCSYNTAYPVANSRK